MGHWLKGLTTKAIKKGGGPPKEQHFGDKVKGDDWISSSGAHRDTAIEPNDCKVVTVSGRRYQRKSKGKKEEVWREN